MSPGADLFIVCRQCGSEVSPYITECPYCGHRLRRRAPKLPKERPSRQRSGDSSVAHLRLPKAFIGAGIYSRPYATIALVLLAGAMWIVTTGGFVAPHQLSLEGPVEGQWWRLLSSQFLYESGVYAFVALLAVGVFGWLLERRHGPLVVLALFLGAGSDRRAGGRGCLRIPPDHRRQRGGALPDSRLGRSRPARCASTRMV